MRNFNSALVIILLSIGFLTSSAQSVPVKLDSALNATLDSMQGVLGVNGLSAAIQLSNDAVWSHGSGVSTFSPLDRLTEDHIFATGSSTKTITGMCILQLNDEGLLSLDDSLHKHLSDLPHVDRNITIRQLLQHRSGLYDIMQNPRFQNTMLLNVNRKWSLEETIRAFIFTPYGPPGATWRYCNTNFVLLGMIIEKLTGKTYHEALNDRFFEPLRLTSYVNLGFDPLPNQIAHLWLDTNGDGQVEDFHNTFSTWKSIFSAVGPAGGYFATSSDLARWMKASMTGSLIEDDTWMEAQNFVSTTMPFGTRYGLGFMTRRHLGYEAYGHGGDISYSTNALYFPELDISLAILCNDGSINSWALSPVVDALLRVYVECASLVSSENLSHLTVSDFLVWPNPAFETIHIDLSLAHPIEDPYLILTNQMGQVVWQGELNSLKMGQQSLELEIPENAAKGMHIISLYSSEGVISQNVVISR